MKKLKSFAARQPVVFVIGTMIVWFMVLLILTAIASSVLRRAYGDAVTATISRLVTTACVLWLNWRMGWLGSSGIARSGRWQVWLIALGGSGYFACAGLYAFFGEISFDFSNLIRSPASHAALITHFAVGLCEEILFRGVVLYGLVRVWGGTKKGLIKSVALTSLLFAALHLLQVFTSGVSLSSALVLAAETGIVSFGWGALVLWGGSIWPAVMLHFVSNAVVAVQGLVIPTVKPDILAYSHLLWFSMLLGMLGIGLLVRTAPRKIVPEVP